MYEVKLVLATVVLVFSIMFISKKFFRSTFFRGPRGLRGIQGERGDTGAVGKDATLEGVGIRSILSQTRILGSNRHVVNTVSINTIHKEKVYVDTSIFIGLEGTVNVLPVIYKNSNLGHRSGTMEILVNEIVFTDMKLKDVEDAYSSGLANISLCLKYGDVIKLRVKTNRRDLLVKCKISSSYEMDKLLFIKE